MRLAAKRYFTENYAAARQAFLAAAHHAGAGIASWQNPAPGQTRELLTDVASLGPPGAENMLVLISGTHGVEGFGGSAVQVGLLREGIADRLGENVGMVMVHALNPYGFACLRRTNEDNVDLNRNFIDHSAPYPENRAYDRLAGVIAPDSMSVAAHSTAMLRLLGYRLRNGNAGLQQAVTRGQYSQPQGLFYGGRFATWSNRTLHEIAARYLAGSARVVVIDVHTGLGAYGHGELILNVPCGHPAYLRAVNWWGGTRVRSAASGESVSADLCGTLNRAVDGMLPDAEVTAAGLEFGTLPPMAVFRALRLENWQYHHGQSGQTGEAKVKQRLLRAFYPDDDRWKSRVWEQGSLVVGQALTALSR